ncbi:MAG: glucose-6-phosphate isomerase [Micrococcaceae bacterium]
MTEVILGKITKEALDNNIDELIKNKIASRIAKKDYTIWGKEAEDESSKRLGWVDLPETSQKLVEPILAKKKELNEKGVNRIVLCGMGGSSLAPEVITQTYGVDLVVLDSTDPEQIHGVVSKDLEKTAVVVSSKSGSTLETDSQKRTFEKLFKEANIDATERIIIVTDPGSPMEKKAKEDGYAIFQADPEVGGRYSALTAFGLVPSGLAGVDIKELLDHAGKARAAVLEDTKDNPALALGVAMAGTKPLRDKTVLVEDGSGIVGFPDWTEQLIAESTGKDQTGVLPVVVNEGDFETKHELPDTVIARLQKDAKADNLGDDQFAVAGCLGEQMYLWEYATAIAGYLLGINPFDQPDVESAKQAARNLLDKGVSEDTAKPVLSDEGVEVYASSHAEKVISGAKTIAEVVEKLTSAIDDKEGYLAIQAYLDREKYTELDAVREEAAEYAKRPVTFGWGPRFLHSTGQYHKGGKPVGVFLQVTGTYNEDIEIPGLNFTFGQVIVAQAGGDANVLNDLGRPVVTLHLTDTATGVKTLTNTFANLKG